MINIIVNSDPRYNINRAALRAAVLEALLKNRVSGKIEVGINIVGDRKMHELNQKFRGIDATTDILSFALEGSFGFISSPDKILRLGDIVISYPEALEDASYDGTSGDDEIKSLVQHGINHLLGMHHV